MATQIHGAGPAGQRSPGLTLAIAGYLAENPPAGTGGSGVTATDAPTAPAEGASASYLVTSAVTWPAGLVWSTDPDGGTAPTITDAALVSLFTVGGTTYAVLGSTYPAPSAPDETGPTAGTLGVVLTSTTADGTVTGAADETELHATPYSFRVDAGTWSAWQAGATYEWTGLTASTEYDFQHRVRDAAGNITEGTVVTDSTDAPSADTTDPTPGTLGASAITSESFTLTVTGASDETALHSQPYRFSTDNGATYSTWQTSAVFNATELDAETEYDCVHQVRDAALNVATGSSIPVETSAASSDLLTFLGTASFSSGGVTHTFTAIPFGDASTNRHIVVAIGARAGAAGRSIVGVTVGGVAATLSGVAFTDLNVMDVAVAHVPTGTSGDVVVTYSSGGAIRSVIGVWAADAAVDVSSAAIDHGTSTASAGPVTIPAGGAGVAIAIEANVGPDSYEIPTFTGGVTLDESITVGSYYAGAFGSTEIAGSATATVSGTDNASLLFVALEQTP